jgi:hypothetical protein
MIQAMQEELDSAQAVLSARIAVEHEAHEKTRAVAQEILKGVPVKVAVTKVLDTPWV